MIHTSSTSGNLNLSSKPPEQYLLFNQITSLKQWFKFPWGVMFHKSDCVAALKSERKNAKKQQGERNLLPSIAHERTREMKQEQPEG